LLYSYATSCLDQYLSNLI